ncbi:MAG: leucine-rich repeat protein [Muribaculaceae bacterium]|nr:leucine-rich repeat protein [Muribaculaceae bacterium]
MNKLSKRLRAFIAIAIMLSVALPTLAHDFEVDGIYYNHLDYSAKTVVVTYGGLAYDYYTHEYSGSVKIPSSVTNSVGTTYSVTKIGDYAFRGCTGLTSITIPNTITSIGNYAFYGCTGLTSVTIPNSVTEIGNKAFYATGWYNNQANGILYLDNCCLGYKGNKPTGALTLNEGTRLIRSSAFSGCTGLTEVNYNAVNCTSMGTSSNPVFSGCTNLKTLNIGNGVKNIPSYAFKDCSGLTSATIGNSVTTISDHAFMGCTKLTSVTIPNSVTEIGDYAFYGCTGLTSVTIPNSVTEIGDEAFYATGWYNNQANGILYLDNCCLGYKGNKPTGALTLNEGTRLIGSSAFSGCTYLNTIVSLNPTPPTCTSSKSFDSDNYSEATLYVPKDSFAKYFVDDVWGLFLNINKIETLASSIKLNNSSIELVKGATTTLSATISPSNATIKDIVWKSNNPQVATVNQWGEVTALSVGTATITATANDGSDISASCNVVVNNTKITLSQTEVSIPVNDIMTLTYTPSLVSVEWSTSNANVAYIKNNSDGSVTVVGMADGEAIVTAKATDGSGASASCKVIVGMVGIEDVEADNNTIEIARYDIHGRQLTEPTKGINIIKMSDGTTRKEIVK